MASTTAAATVPVPPRQASDFVGLFPLDLWRRIFTYLDATSLLAVAEASPKLKRIAFCSKILKRLTFDPETDERIVKKFVLATREQLVDGDRVQDVPLAPHVLRLRLNNCLAFPSASILDIARYCHNLQELSCVNCVVEPIALFDLLALKLTGVKKLEWSLYEDSHYKTWLDKRTVTHLRTFPRLQGPRLNTMYVELAVTDETVYFLDNFVAQCRRLRHLHVHAVRKEDPDVPGSEACRRELTKRKRHFETFKYSHEELLTPINLGTRMMERDMRRRTYSAEDAVWGNVDCRFKPEETTNLVTFADVIERKVILRGIKQAVVVVEGDARSTCLFEHAAGQPDSWKDVSRLSLALMPPRGLEVPTSPTAHRGYMNPMMQFFDACVSRLVELNMTAFHFTEEADCCLVVASTLPNLRSLALAPCGVNHAHSLESLACGCLFLEHLDVGSDGALSCEACHCPLLFTARRIWMLHETTRLRRLSIGETATVADLTFLRLCRVVELRLNVDCEDAAKLRDCTCTLGELLCSNPLLTSLTLVAGRETLGVRFAENLSAVRSLQHLCVLTATRTAEREAEDFFMILEDRLPQLRSLHAHYLDVRGTVQVRTWLRQWRPDYTPPTIAKWRSSEGVFLHDRPCLGRLCSVSTFIGLVRPRNRY
ncbi:hypothetical protein HPB52_022417 [Rhipicephalus sanguineus]|uniref:F-box domain-containing protein n=1 Tax=Rhipicephalus sanguineus TaxID=34632 RepID=A0A9D4T0T5_RHISA|nr:hypothetical protein HPB52_022417 [Rhipicephalus sanguineus]